MITGPPRGPAAESFFDSRCVFCEKRPRIMSGPSRDVSVIIPTLACRERASSLMRAIDSVTRQQDARGIARVVVNGQVGAPDLLAHLRRRTDIRLTELAEPSLPGALQAGRALIDTPFFSVL